jgi:nucleoside-diphosphate-sugar epimerase
MQPTQPGRHRDQLDDATLGPGVLGPDAIGVDAAQRGPVFRRRRISADHEAGPEAAVEAGPGHRVLVLGGATPIGHAIAAAAIADGLRVTCFDPEKAGPGVAGARQVRGERDSGSDLQRLVDDGPWHAVLDAAAADAAEEPAVVLLGAKRLRPAADRYVLISSLAAHRPWPHHPLDEASPRWPARAGARRADPDVASLPDQAVRGTLHAGCELAVQEVYGDAALILRAGTVIGPYDRDGRLALLLAEVQARLLRGEPVPGGPAADRDALIQPVDVRDLAAFALDLVEAGTGGAYNVVSPRGLATYGELIDACVAAVGSDPGRGHGTAGRDPGTAGRDPGRVGGWVLPAVDAGRATAAGLACRPLPHTIRDTWHWLSRDLGL